MGATASKRFVDNLGRVSLPPLICVCCESTYIDRADGNEESLGEIDAAEPGTAKPWTAGSVDEEEEK